MPGVRVEGLRVSHGGRPVLRGVDVEVGPATIAAILGASGSGKTTLLRTIAGLERPDAGAILIGADDVTRWPPARRDVAMVFQQAPLDPTRDLRANLRFPLAIRRVPAEESERRVVAEARAFSIAGLLDRLPREVSEGQRHAAATARAVVRGPRVLLLDEPLADLDPIARARALDEIRTVQRGYGATLLLATNDQAVAASLASHVVVLVDGQVAQVGTYGDIHAAPATTAVAELVGDPPMTLLAGVIGHAPGTRPNVTTKGLDRPTHDPAVAALPAGTPVTVGIRPEHVRISADRAHAVGIVRRVGLLGPDGIVQFTLADGGELTARLPRPLPRRGDVVPLRIERVHVYDAVGQLVTVAR